MPPVDNEIVEIRERLTAIETTLGFIKEQMACMKPQNAIGTGMVVIPAAVVVGAFELVRFLIERFV